MCDVKATIDDRHDRPFSGIAEIPSFDCLNQVEIIFIGIPCLGPFKIYRRHKSFSCSNNRRRWDSHVDPEINNFPVWRRIKRIKAEAGFEKTSAWRFANHIITVPPAEHASRGIPLNQIYFKCINREGVH